MLTLNLRPVAAVVTLCVALAACSGSGDSSDSSAPPAGSSYQQSAQTSYTYLLPLYEMASTRKAAFDTMIQNPNVFINDPMLSNASSRGVTTPNVDTLYSSAWLILNNGPVEIDIPDSGTRYFSLALLDFYTNVFSVRGTRVDGGAAKKFWVVGPQWQGTAPSDVEVIHSPTNSAWALGRTYVENQADLPAADAVQSQLTATAMPDGSNTPPPKSVSATAPSETDFPSFFQYADELMVENPVAESSDAGALAQLGLGNGTFDPTKLTSEQTSDLNAGANAAYQTAIAGSLGNAAQQGWIYPKSDLGAFGDDFGYRAIVAVGGLGALPVQEAVYIYGAGDAATPQRYDGTHNYTMTFASGALPPNSAFWSLTLYQPQSDGTLQLYDNPGSRYDISSSTSGLTYGSDGSLTVYVQNADPGAAKNSNWLPAPSGPFALILRVYLPGSGLLDGSYLLPPVVQQ